MAVTSEDKSMMIVWVIAAVLVVLGIYLAIPGTPAKKPMTGAAPEPAATEKPMAKDEAQKPAPAAPAGQTAPAAPTEKSQ